MAITGFDLVSLNTNRGGIQKQHRLGAVNLGSGGLEGDRQSNLRHHGGPDQTVCLYAEEDYAALRELGVTDELLPAGAFGENFTTRGVDWREIAIGQRFRSMDDIEIEISSFRVPCTNLTALSSDLPGALYREDRFGAYARTLAGGAVRVGERFLASDEPDSSVTLREAQQALFGDKADSRAQVIASVLAQPALSARTRDVFQKRASKS